MDNKAAIQGTIHQSPLKNTVMAEKEEVVRQMHCTRCDSVTNHTIEYRGQEISGKKLVFKSICHVCKCEDLNHVTMKDYDALIGRIIFDVNLAP